MTERRLPLVVFVLALVAAVHQPALATGVVGTGTPESCTQEALKRALNDWGKVTFNCGPNPVTITVTWLPHIQRDTLIDGGNLITLSGGGTARVLYVVEGRLALTNLTIVDAVDTGGGGASVVNNTLNLLYVNNCHFSNNTTLYPHSFGGGGAIWSVGPVKVSNSTFSNNSSGAIVTRGSQPSTIANCTFTGNSGEVGAGIINYGPDPLTVKDSTFVANRGGAIVRNSYSPTALTVTGSVFIDNTRPNRWGSAIADIDDYQGRGETSRLSVSNCTFSNNSDVAIYSSSVLSLTNSTFIDNLDGSIAKRGPLQGTVYNTILANSGSTNCLGSVVDGGHNLDSGTTCGFSGSNGSLSNTPPFFDPAGLADNGGPTQTIALLFFSPAINAGDEIICAAAPVNNLDQRGYRRPGTGAANCSIGAFEFNANPSTPTFTSTPTPPMPTPTPSRTCIVGTGASASCTEAALDACLAGGGSSGGIVTFNCGGATTIIVSSTKFISSDTTIDGGGSTISGANGVGVFSVNSGVNFTIQNLTIANGGRAIVNNSGTLTVNDSTFSGHMAPDFGGAIANFGTLAVTNSTFSGNSAFAGGAIDNNGTLTVTNSTFWGNSGANGGGAIFNAAGTLLVTNSTFAGNLADGLGDAIATAAGQVIITNSIVAGTGLGNCYAYAGADITDGGHNIDEGLSCGFGFPHATGSLTLTNPMLDPEGLRDNGGPTQSIGLLYFSPAINAGGETICTAAPVNNLDQRGYLRPGTGATNCSIGAFEFNASPPPNSPTPSFANTPTGTPTPTPEPCVGDCKTDRQVTVDEIVTMVNVALGNADVSTCEAGDANRDGQITVDEILAAAGNALNGCPK